MASPMLFQELYYQTSYIALHQILSTDNDDSNIHILISGIRASHVVFLKPSIFFFRGNPKTDNVTVTD